MRKVFGFLALALTLLAAIAPVSAQEAEEEEKDLVEISAFVGKGLPQGGITDYQDTLGAKSGFETGFESGYFVSPKVVLGLHFSYTQFSIDEKAKADGLDHKLYFPALYVKYLVNTNSNWVPYVKALAGPQIAKFTRKATNPAGDRYRALSYGPAFGYSLGIGVFYYTADYSGLYVEACYSGASTQNVEATYATQTYPFEKSVRVVDLRAGIRFLIGSGE